MKRIFWLSALYFAILINSQIKQGASEIPRLEREFLGQMDDLDNIRLLKEPGYPNHEAAREDTTIVTGFLDIGRANWSSQARPIDAYFERAARVMSLKNKMVIFIQPELRERVTALRQVYDPDLSKTTIVDRTITQCRMYEHRQKILEIMNSVEFKNFLGYYYGYIEFNNPDYDIAVFCKFNMLEDTIVNGYQKASYYVWMDFGMRPTMLQPSLIETYFPHTDGMYDNGKKFRIDAWERYKELKEHTMQENLKNHNVSILTGVFGGHEQGVLQAIALFKRALQEMLHANMVGDDQNVLDWAYVINSDIFDVNEIGDWSVILVKF